MKRLLLIIALTLGLTAAPFVTLAATGTTTSPETDATRLANLKTKGNTEIVRRLDTLVTLTAGVKASKKLAAANKATLLASISSDQTRITALQSKLALDTDLATARADVQSIVVDYRIYRLLVPQVRISQMADAVLLADDKFAILANQINSLAVAGKDAGNDTTSLLPLLADLNAKIAQAKNQATAALGVIALYPSQYDQISTFHGDVVQARTSLKAARDDIGKAIQILGAYHEKTPIGPTSSSGSTSGGTTP